MGSMMKADSERRELVRERRQARMERKQQRRRGARAQALADQRAATGAVSDPACGAAAGRRGA